MDDSNRKILKLLVVFLVISGGFLVIAHPIFLRYVVHFSVYLLCFILILGGALLSIPVQKKDE